MLHLIHYYWGLASTQNGQMTIIHTNAHREWHKPQFPHSHKIHIRLVEPQALKAANSRNLIEASRNQRMSWACQMLPLPLRLWHTLLNLWVIIIKEMHDSLASTLSIPLSLCFSLSFIINETHDCSQLQCIKGAIKWVKINILQTHTLDSE